MRSGTSFFDWTVFKKTVCRFWPLWGLYSVIWLVALPLTGLMLLRLEANAMPGIDGGYIKDFAFYRVPAFAETGALQAAVVFGILAAMAVFSHLYNARSANLFGSLPIRREGLFLTHYMAGLSFLIVPNVVIFLLTLLVEAAGGCVCMNGLLFWLAVTCGEGFFFYTLAVFCAMFTGHILALPAFYAIINGLVVGIITLAQVIFEAFCYGFAGFPGGVYAVAEWFTPAVQLGDAVQSWVNEDEAGAVLDLEIQGLGTVGIYAAVAVALAVCAVLLYRKRRLESAGDVVAVRPMRPVFKYGVALCVGLTLGLGTAAMIGGGDITLMAAIAVWGVIGYFAAEMLLQKSFKVFRKWKGAAAVTAVFIVLFLVVGFDLTGFETRIPDPDSVESVHVYGLSAMYLDDSGDSFAGDITDPDIIPLITRLHEEAVAQRDADGRITWRSDRTYTSLIVTYHLKNGGTLARRYYNVWVRPDEVNQEGTAAWALQQIHNNRELCWQMYGFDNLEDYLASDGRLTEVEHQFYNSGEGWTGVYYYGADADALLAAVKEDFFAGRIGARRVTEDPWKEYKEEYELGARGYLSFRLDRQSGGYYSVRIAMSDTASSTRAVLEKMADRAVRFPADTAVG